ncbi:MAG: phosphoribosylformylglycinamidine synthase subunit PurL [Planctomycetota bacterium]
MLWEIEIRPLPSEIDREAVRVLGSCRSMRLQSITAIRAAKSFLIQGDLNQQQIEQAAQSLLVDTVVEAHTIHPLSKTTAPAADDANLLNVMFKPGVTDNIAFSTQRALADLGFAVEAVSTCRKYWVNPGAAENELKLLASKILSNDAIEQVARGTLALTNLSVGREYQFQLQKVAIRELTDEQLQQLSKTGQLYLSLTEMQTIQNYFRTLDRDPTDAELETVAQTWSEHCSHKTLGGRVHYVDDTRDIQFQNMLKETIFAATRKLREQAGEQDWCVSVFRDNAGVVEFHEKFHACIKVETHNHPSALEPYGGANTGLGGVIRDPLGTGLGAKPICNTDVFCFAPPDTPYETLPPGVLHPQVVARGVVSGVRDYGNRMGIPTVNGAVYFDERYLGNPLVYCGNVALIPIDMVEKGARPGDLIVAVGGRTGRDGIHGATFSSAELTQESESLSGGAVQIGNAITEKMVLDVILEARDKGLYTGITDCGAGGFSSAVGEMGAECGAEVWLDQAPLKYTGLSYTEIWISEAQERMVLSVPPQNWPEFQALCAAEGVEASAIGEFKDNHRLVLKYQDQVVGDLAMEFLHDGRPPVIREAIYKVPEIRELNPPTRERYDEDLQKILGSLNVCSKEWIIRQYDHEVQSGSVVKPLVGVACDGPSDAAVVRPILDSNRGLVIACGMNPHFGDFDPYWMAASAIDEAVRNCVAVGADPSRIAILDNFCWGYTDRPETLGSLVRASLACHDVAIAFGTPFVSGKDSLNNEFSYFDTKGEKQTVAIPASLLITAMGQMADVNLAVTMDLKKPGNLLYQIGVTKDELGGSHFSLVNKLTGGRVPQVDVLLAVKIFAALHRAINSGLVRSCHDLSEGGLAAAVAEMAFSGEVGVELTLAELATQTRLTDSAQLLFSESNTRFVVEIVPEKAAQFEALFGGLPLAKIGKTVAEQVLKIDSPQGTRVVDSELQALKASWQKPLAWN